MANWFCSVFNCCMCRKRLSSPRCRSELIDSAWVVIVPGQKCINPPPPPKKTFDSAHTFRSHFRTVDTLARHRLLKLNSIFSSTYTSTLFRLYKSYIRSLFDYGASATCVGRGYKLISFREHFPFHHSSITTESGSTLTLHPFMTET